MKRLRTTVALVTLAMLAVLAAACGNDPSSAGPPGASSTHSQSAKRLSFARCMRAHGVPDFPDPSRTGDFPKATLSRLARTDSRYRTATTACAHLLPDHTGPTQAQAQQVREEGVRFAECMRHHGVSLPDPASTGRIPDPSSLGINQGSPRFEAANQACGRFRPPYMPSNAAYNAYARTQAS